MTTTKSVAGETGTARGTKEVTHGAPGESSELGETQEAGRAEPSTCTPASRAEDSRPPTAPPRAPGSFDNPCVPAAGGRRCATHYNLPLADDDRCEEGRLAFDDAPYVCPGCFAVGEERCAPGCIDDELRNEREHAIESGDYDDRYDENGDSIAETELELQDRMTAEWTDSTTTQHQEGLPMSSMSMDEAQQVEALKEVVRPQIDQAILEFVRALSKQMSSVSQSEIDRCISIVEMCRMHDGRRPNVDMAAWYAALDLAAGRLREWRTESGRAKEAGRRC